MFGNSYIRFRHFLYNFHAKTQAGMLCMKITLFPKPAECANALFHAPKCTETAPVIRITLRTRYNSNPHPQYLGSFKNDETNPNANNGMRDRRIDKKSYGAHSHPSVGVQNFEPLRHKWAAVRRLIYQTHRCTQKSRVGRLTPRRESTMSKSSKLDKT